MTVISQYKPLQLKHFIMALMCVGMLSCSVLPNTNPEDSPIRARDLPIDINNIPDTALFDEFTKRRGGVTIAVTGFEDLTGSRNETGASTSVSGSGILLLEHILRQHSSPTTLRVFTRKLLGDLINERRLAAQLNEAHATQTRNQLSESIQSLLGDSPIKPLVVFPELIPVNYLVTGAVIGYDKNVSDLGAGAGALGVSNRYQKSIDQVTVMVQLINVATGEIIGVGIASESITSNLYNAGVFKLLQIDKILELEGGGSINEPKTYALYIALEKAVQAMLRDSM